MHTSEVQLTNVVIAENTAFGSNGGGIWLSDVSGTLLDCTIANNRSTAADQISGAIFGSGLVLENTIIAGNTAMYVPGCTRRTAAERGTSSGRTARCAPRARASPIRCSARSAITAVTPRP